MFSLRVLGPVDLRGPNGETLHAILAQPKQLGLLAYLCVAGADGMQRRDVAASLFWPERDTERARAALRTALFRLREALGEAIVTRGAQEVGADGARITCDALELERACAEGRWRDALERDRGDFLEGFLLNGGTHDLEEWIERRRTRCRELASRACWLGAEALASSGDLTGAIQLARRALSTGPSDELGVRRLITLFERNGDRAGALAAYEALRRRMSEEYGAEPSAETRAMIDAVRERRVVATDAVREPRVVATVGVPGASGAPRHRRRALAAGAALATLALLIAAAWSVARRSVATAPAPADDVDEMVNGVRGFVATSPGMPRPLSHMSVAYDERRDVVYMFGGVSGIDLFDDLWVVDNASNPTRLSWTRRVTTGARPAARWMHTTVYDPASDRVILFGGGLGVSSPCANDLWALANSSMRAGASRWHRIGTPGGMPEPRAEHGAVYLAGARRMIVFGGHDCIARRMSDTWVLVALESGAPRWRRLATHGPSPPPRSHPAMVYDAAADRVLLYAGMGSENEILDDVWELSPASSDTATWRELRIAARARPRIFLPRAAWDRVSRQMIVFGSESAPSGADTSRCEVWFLRGDAAGWVTWSQAPPFRRQPGPRNSAGLAYAPARDRLIVLGGEGQGSRYSDMWVFMNATGVARQP